MRKRPKQITFDAGEDWQKPIYEEVPETKPVKFQKPPKRYEQNFLARLDGRTENYKTLVSAYNNVMSDLGGEDNLSHVQHSLVERFVFLEFVMKHLEKRIVQNPKKREVILSRWIQGLNSLSGLARTIGLERRAKKIQSLQTYVREKK
ncbi:MAG: hypothetical protein C0397_19495 [Odoribacter sp.]|nr:hypothetical protein [Odoribacter sp.]